MRDFIDITKSIALIILCSPLILITAIMEYVVDGSGD